MNREPEPQDPSTDGTSPRTKRSRRARAHMMVGGALAGVAMLGGLSIAGGRAGAIVSGTATPIERVPWQVSLRAPDGHFCGGSIVDPRVVATAAHCTAGAQPADVQVRAGVTRHEDSGGQDRLVSRIIEHPDDGKGAADIALVVLSEPLELGPKVQTIGLATDADVARVKRARVSGWGTTSETGEALPAELQSAEVPLIDDEACSRSVGQQDESVDTVRELCAEGVGKGSCYGDSGGPLVVAGADGSPKLAGVVSWGIECGKGPGMYAEVPAFEVWLRQGIEAGLSGSAHPAGPDRLPVDQYDEEPPAEDEGAWEDDGRPEDDSASEDNGDDGTPEDDGEILLDLGDLLSQDELPEDEVLIFEGEVLVFEDWPADLAEMFAGIGSFIDR